MLRIDSRVKNSYLSYMHGVKIADLKNNLSRYLLHVRKGGEITVLDRDTPVARIVPFGPREARSKAAAKDDYWTDERLLELERQGAIRRGDPAAVSDWLETTTPRKLPVGVPGAVETLIRMRRESTR